MVSSKCNCRTCTIPLKELVDGVYSQLLVEPTSNGWRIVYPDGSIFDSQIYNRAQDARRAITMMRKI